MREQEMEARLALQDFNNLQITIRGLESRYRKDCITEEEMASQLQNLRQIFMDKAKEMTSLFKNSFFKESLVANLIAKYKKKFEYKPEEVYDYLAELYADMAELYKSSCEQFLTSWANANDAETTQKFQSQIEIMDKMLKALEERRMARASRNFEPKKEKKPEPKQEEPKPEEVKPEEKPEKDKKQGKGKGKKGLRAVVIRPRGGSKIYHVKSSETKAKEASAEKAAQRALKKPESEMTFAPRQMSR